MSEAMIPADLPLRNDLIGEVPYGAPQLDVPVCLNVNENPYPPDHAVVRSIVERVKQVAPTLNRYPDREHIELREAFVKYLKEESGAQLTVEQVWGANGSNEIMLQLFQAFGGLAVPHWAVTRPIRCTPSMHATRSPVGTPRTASRTLPLMWTVPSRTSMRSSRPWWCSPARTIRPAPNCP